MGVSLIDSETPIERIRYGEIFKRYFPIYLSYGMSSSEYWDEEPELTNAYREAHQMKLQQKNIELYLQYQYTAHALNTVLGNAFKPKGGKTLEFLNEPIPLTQKEAKEREEAKQRARYERMREMMMMASQNSKRKGGADGNNN